MTSPIYDHPAVCQAYFFPRPCGPLPATATDDPVRLRLPDGTAIGAYACRRRPGAPTLLYLHGNGEIIADQLEHWPTWAEAAGANIVFVDYPGYGTSEGEPTFTGCRQAALAALDWLLADPEGASVIIAGRSVGSIFALDAAATRAGEPRLAGLMLESGVADLRQRLEDRMPWEQLGVDRAALCAELERDFDHRAKLGQLRCPVLVLHCRDDGLVPFGHGQQLAEWAGERLVRLVAFEAGDHNSIQWVNEAAYRRHLAELVAITRKTNAIA